MQIEGVILLFINLKQSVLGVKAEGTETDPYFLIEYFRTLFLLKFYHFEIP